MKSDRQEKPVLDAVNDAIGALSDLLHALRARAREATRETKADARATGRKVKADAKTIGNAGKRAVARAKDAGEGLLDKAAKVWKDLRGKDAPKANRRRRATAKVRA